VVRDIKIVQVIGVFMTTPLDETPGVAPLKRGKKMTKRITPEMEKMSKWDFTSPNEVYPREKPVYHEVLRLCVAKNSKPVGNASFDDFLNVGWVFRTNLPGSEGEWEIKDILSVVNGRVCVKCLRVVQDSQIESEVRFLSLVDLGIVQDPETMLFNDVKTNFTLSGRLARIKRTGSGFKKVSKS